MGQQRVNQTPLNPERKYRVVQWATGFLGACALRVVVEHPSMNLVGAYVHSEAKAGHDAGELCGLGPIGVTATNDIDEIIALKPDCILYMQEGCNFDDVCRLLASGANIVTTRAEFHNPAMLDPAMRERVEEACRRGGTSIHSTGASPDFITEAVPLVLTSLQRRLDCLTIEEFADLTTRNSPDMIFQVMGFGKPPGKFDENIVTTVKNSFGPSLSVVADAVSMPIDAIEASGEFATARHTTNIAAGVIEAGTVAAERITVSCMHSGRPLLRFRANWYCTTDIDPSWDLRETGWHVLVEGDAPLDINVYFPVPPEQWAAVAPAMSVNRVVNAIPFICAAAPGIRTVVDLPHFIPILR